MLLPLVLVLAVAAAEGQRRGFRLQPARYKDCGSVFQVDSVDISAPLAKKEACFNRHLLVKERRVQICINATIPEDSAVPLPLTRTSGFKNSAHGTIPPLGPQSFCEIERNACKDAKPGCPDLVLGSSVRLCSTLRVPDVPLVQPDVLVRYRTLYEPNMNPRCEESYELSPGQIPLICLDLETKVVDRPACPSSILG